MKALSEPHGKAGRGLLNAMLNSFHTGESLRARENRDRTSTLVFWEALSTAMLRMELECPEWR